MKSIQQYFKQFSVKTLSTGTLSTLALNKNEVVT